MVVLHQVTVGTIIPLLSSSCEWSQVQSHKINVSFMQIFLPQLLFPVVALICHPWSFMAWCLDCVLGLFCCMSSEWSGDLSSVSLIIKLLWKRASALFLTCNAKCRPGYLASCLPRCFSLKPYWLLPDYRSTQPQALFTPAHACACTETSVNKVSLASDWTRPGPKTQTRPQGTHKAML